jgi:hypothetical protein
MVGGPWPQFYRLTYSNTRPAEDPKLFQARDGVACTELTAPLPALGYTFGTTIHFYPDDKRRLTDFPAFGLGDLLASFGMDGYSTLIWNRLVRLRYPDLLTKPGFVMAEIIFKQPIPARPLTPEFATDPAYIDVHLLTKS